MSGLECEHTNRVLIVNFGFGRHDQLLWSGDVVRCGRCGRVILRNDEGTRILVLRLAPGLLAGQ